MSVVASKQTDAHVEILDLHATQAQNTSQSSLCLRVHLQVPHQGDGQQTQDKVADRGEDAVNVGDINKVVHIHTSSRSPRPHPLPEILHRLALQCQHEPKHKAHDSRDANNDPEEYRMEFSDREAKKCQCDRNLSNHTCEDIACLAEPPPLYRERKSKNAQDFNLGSLRVHAQTTRLQYVEAQGLSTFDLYHKPPLLYRIMRTIYSMPAIES
ncbi:unnamed protein product [Aspergillus oryzae]|nr:unnamed protein product [Aspergillus oryzae]